MIKAEGLTKRFGRVLAVDRLDLHVREGDRYGFLGPNGSGKTTTVRMMLGLVYATSGSLTIMDAPMPRGAGQVLRSVGALVEGPAAWGHLSGRSNLALIDAAGPTDGGGRRTRRRRIDDALERVGLASVGRRPVKAYSLGMRQRLGLAAATLRTPSLLILDEPTNGLDPQGIHEVRSLLIELNQAGTTVFLSSHLLAEVEQLCTRVGVVDRGRLVTEQTMADLRRPTGMVVLHTPDPSAAHALLNGRVVRREGTRLVVRHDDVAALAVDLVRGGVRIAEIGPERRSLEDVVLALTSHGSDRVDGIQPPAPPGPARADVDQVDRLGGINAAARLEVLDSDAPFRRPARPE